MGNKNLFLPELLEDFAQVGQSMAAAMEKAQKAVEAVTATSNRIRRTLAGFDQIKRLEKKNTSGSTGKKGKKEDTTAPEDTQVQNLLTLQQVLERLDLSVLDFIPGSLSNAGNSFEILGKRLWNLWQNQMLPMGQWISQSLIPTVGQYLGDSVQNAAAVISGFGTLLTQTWQLMKNETGQAAWSVGQSFLGITDGLDALVMKFFGGSRQIGNAAGDMLTQLASLGGGLGRLLGNMQTGINTLATGAVSALQTVIGYLQGEFNQGWQAGVSALKTPTKGAFNGVIGCLNQVLGGMGSTVNGMVEAVNKLKIKIPDWVPGLGGKQFSVSLKTVTTPQIPYLAKGAVLPANQPFLAVVGDQKHGTNVEAPLATIQEAVAAVMADHTAGNMAGHEATVAVLNRILEAVLGIDVGEAVIARAAQSYRTKEAVMKGGGF